MAELPGRQIKSNRFIQAQIVSNGQSDSDNVIVSEVEPELQAIGRKYLFDPLGFAEDLFFWGKPGTRLADKPGLMDWQEQVLQDVGYGLREHPDVFRLGIASGKGAGKTALAAILYIWHVTTRLESQTTCTATTGAQLGHRLWSQVGIFLRASKLYEFFSIQATKLTHRHIEAWLGINQTWTTEKTEAFQGSHEKYVAFIVDEASGVPDAILETIETGLTDSHVFLALLSNPTKASGRFRQHFDGITAHLWHTVVVDTRDVEIVNQDRIQEQLDECGGNEDDDSFRVNVRGLFPRQDFNQVIPEWIVHLAQERYARSDLQPTKYDAVVIGADIASMGMNKTVFTVRHGCRILETHIFAKTEAPQTIDLLCGVMDKWADRTPHCFIDSDGYGAAIYQSCRQAGYRVEPVYSGGAANDEVRFGNRRAELWFTLRDWLLKTGCLDPADTLLARQLSSVWFKVDSQNRMQIESKQEMQSRGVVSPDNADALVYSFTRLIAGEVMRRTSPQRFATGADSPHAPRQRTAGGQVFATGGWRR